jgi:erythromycin esterase
MRSARFLLAAALLPAAIAQEPSPVRDWIAGHAIRLITPEAGHGFEDMQPLKQVVGNVRIVALGEATHGTREFFQLKHRLVAYAVANLGFTVFAIEAGLTECRQIDAYVTTGRGNPRAILRTVPIWNTEEMLALIDWLRDWNADPRHARKVHFAGVDLQTPAFALRSVAAYLEHVPPAERPSLAALNVLAGDTSAVDAAGWQRIVRDAEALGAVFDAHRDSWAATGADDLAATRRDVSTLEQAARVYARAAADPDADDSLRDGFMADNAAWVLGQQPTGARMLLWAHNGHVSLERRGRSAMGAALRRRLGRDYVSVGFVFGSGAFRTVEARDGRAVLTTTSFGRPPASDISAPFAATNKPLLIADLRHLPSGPVSAWFARPHPTREAGGTPITEADATRPIVLLAEFDAVVYVDRTTGTRPLD